MTTPFDYNDEFQGSSGDDDGKKAKQSKGPRKNTIEERPNGKDHPNGKERQQARKGLAQDPFSRRVSRLPVCTKRASRGRNGAAGPD
ncbi:MAG TPA: hypothetical protein VNZ26_28525 [Vicinamibacterales bacterium]|jgi:hypothetical protein|nr:hypothetical protein [Vicinamibacterales bacterium]